MPVRKSHAWRLADLVLEEGLEEFVRRQRDAGASWRLIARELYDATNQAVDVSPETLRGWLAGCDLNTEAAVEDVG